MIENMKYIFDLCIFIALVILMGIRFWKDSGSWMVVIQYIGFGIAYADMFVNVLLVKKESKNFKKVLMILLAGMLIVVAVALLGCLRIVGFLATQKAMDIITLGTLLISLPEKLYLELLKERELK
ncbi:MAG: hypothetical protein NC489_29385 [Ruminococcus flavefaciens]|nr:hypothetical protein [Ruminococcus flavefaciens]